MNVLISTQNNSVKNECNAILKQENTHRTVKSGCSPMQFLNGVDRNKVLLQVLKSFSNVGNEDFQTISSSKSERICLAYETVLSARHLLIVTHPSLSKNMRMLKLTHNKALINSLGYPSGGKYETIRKLLNEDLPELMPPTGDFCSTDDNIQVKRVVSTRDLKENFKFSVKVVDNHTFFQNVSDKHSSILKNPDLQPQYWLHQPRTNEVEQFEQIINSYKKVAKKVRSDLLTTWIKQEESSHGDLVQRISYLRSTNNENIWPCARCSANGNKISPSLLSLTFLLC